MARLQEIVADFRETIEHLGEIEKQMDQVLADVQSQGLSRERLLVGHAMLNDLRGILTAASQYCPARRDEERAPRKGVVV
jgi:hypothetical protein